MGRYGAAEAASTGRRGNPVPAGCGSYYYTLTAGTLSRKEIPFDKSPPRYPISVVVLARLAADHRYQGQGIGEKTLITALRKSVELTNSGLPAVGTILDIPGEDAPSLYQRYEIFEPFTDDPLRFFAPMTVLQQIKANENPIRCTSVSYPCSRPL